ncbi:MAG: AI-2E family transporter [Anaerolineae bacterium]
MESSAPRETTRWSARQVMVATVFVVLVAVALWAIYRYRIVLTIVFLGIVLGTAARPAVEWLRRRGVPPLLGVLLVYLVLAALITGFVLLAAPLVIEQIGQVSRDLPGYYAGFREALSGSRVWLFRLLAQQLPALPSLEALPEASAEGALSRAALFFRSIGLLFQGTLSVAAVFLVGLFWTLENRRAVQYIALWLPAKRREGARSLMADAETMVAGYLRAQALLMLFIGACATTAYLILGLPYPLVLGVFAGLMEAIPVLGPALGAVPAGLVALSYDPTRVIFVVISAVVIQALENYVLVPRIMRGSVGVNPVVSLVALIAFAALFGLPGAVLAIPLAAILQMLLNRFVLRNEPVVDAGRDRASVLRYEARALAQDARKLLIAKEHDITATVESGDEIEDSVEAIAADLDRLIEAGTEVAP